MRQFFVRTMGFTKDFMHMEAAGGIVLVGAALLALLIANTPLFGIYDHLLNGIKFRFGFVSPETGFDLQLEKSILLWINDGLMALFFFLVGLEIKRELVEGELSTRDRALLPALAAVGGMLAPAAIFWFINQDYPHNMAGWAIPSATDIAFALGVLALLGSRAPTSLKILLTAIAVIDDLGAIIIIALFYSHGLHPVPFYFAAAALLGLFILNRRNVSSIPAYVILGVILWVSVLQSGVHATLAGVAAALFVPTRCRRDPEYSPLKTLEHTLHPWIVFGVLPLFAFANAGVPFAGMGLHSLVDPVTLGIVLGLFFGKQIGIFLVLVLAVKLGLSPRPAGASWLQLYGVSILCGIGFTMSLFIGGLAYQDVAMQASVRLGVLLGSLISAVVGYMILSRCAHTKPA
ncbi:MAG: Na+/H+ antiporter NhaA [Alphaproteobacteria bacterium]|nr:Na+/H+ antiporter NhaA [Alphaproteobacteria bacterium]